MRPQGRALKSRRRCDFAERVSGTCPDSMAGNLRQQLAQLRDEIFPRRMCAKKKRYVSEKYALSVLRFRQPKEPEKLFQYHCPECKGWHITKMIQPNGD